MTRRPNPRDVSSRANEQQGAFATNWVAEQYGLVVDSDTESWYDARLESTGAKYEVKSTREQYDNGNEGRFRLWEDQHISLLASDRTGVAWYVFVLLDQSGNVVDHRRMKPKSVTKIVHSDNGDWNLAGHSERSGRQHKIRWSEIFR